ncbi:DUF4886 domain-containing protein [Larkinella rosea]|uniref:DUF4886 domain-containing protein n=1 Tax=Larkinella rosea TaxID=2025312 RepID=A0A3P1BJG0_9BACT|nr:DUF4886 domain-containing protein [Larkinella rosea]RRB01122.1 DUF4886 domain-containing protein [Larkinella rosea]
MNLQNRPIRLPALFAAVVFLLLVFTGKIAVSQTGSPGNTENKKKGSPLHLFIIGNSFSGNAAKYLRELSEEGGHELTIGRAELGGCSLQRHWEIAEAAEANPDNPKGKAYNGKSLKMLLSEGKWDVVTLQQYSMLSGDVDSYRPYAKKLYDYIKKLQPSANIVFHQTWAYRADADGFGQVAQGVLAKSEKEMWEKSRAAYHTIARELGASLIPTGDAFWRISSDSKWGFQKDTGFDYSQPQAPNLPNQNHSLHMGYTWNNNKLGFDSHHANAAGCYLGSLVWYGFLFHESPVRLKFVPEGVADDFAAQLKKTAWTTVQTVGKSSVK